jgi:DNA-binding response OmpR family regulator
MPVSTPRKPLVVVAEPDVTCAALMARELEWAGYEVITTGDGAEALALVDVYRPDALVVEVAIRGMTGYSLVREIRQAPRNRLMPIVMVSPRAGKLDRDFAFTVGADEYIKKPFAYSTVVARVSQLAPVPTPVPVRPACRPRLRLPLPQPALANASAR